MTPLQLSTKEYSIIRNKRGITISGVCSKNFPELLIGELKISGGERVSMRAYKKRHLVMSVFMKSSIT